MTAVQLDLWTHAPGEREFLPFPALATCGELITTPQNGSIELHVTWQHLRSAEVVFSDSFISASLVGFAKVSAIKTLVTPYFLGNNGKAEVFKRSILFIDLTLYNASR